MRKSHAIPKPFLVPVLLTAGFLAAEATVCGAERLELALVRQAKPAIRLLKERGYRNVGVLKFLVAKEGGKLSDNVGTLNTNLATRLEVALIVANDPRTPLGIIHDASSVAARTPGANHLSAEGRRKLFETRYPLAWGDRQVEADAFITGLVQVSKDLRTLTISLVAIDKAQNKLTPLGTDFQAANEAGKLSEMGESFIIRGAFDDASVVQATPSADRRSPAPLSRQETQVLATAAAVHSGSNAHPLADPAAPVKLEVRYDNRPVAVEMRDGQAFVAEPREGQKVGFVLRRDSSKERYGLVLKVNGENTHCRERLPDLSCLKWILDPGDGPIQITGYQIDAKTAQEFRVLSSEESKANEIHYGADVGTVTLTVFRELRGKPEPPPVEDEATYVAAVQQGKLPEEKADNFHALKAQLLETSNRGLIGEGQQIGSKVERVSFTPDPTPLMSVTIIYYRR